MIRKFLPLTYFAVILGNLKYMERIQVGEKRADLYSFLFCKQGALHPPEVRVKPLEC